eukprot:m.93294 g.93294  ORF g.93294 m.93294 type:complete len:220 (+) comp12124_c0_seq2:1472-2131(+)
MRTRRLHEHYYDSTYCKVKLAALTESNAIEEGVLCLECQPKVRDRATEPSRPQHSACPPSRRGSAATEINDGVSNTKKDISPRKLRRFDWIRFQDFGSQNRCGKGSEPFESIHVACCAPLGERREDCFGSASSRLANGVLHSSTVSRVKLVGELAKSSLWDTTPPTTPILMKWGMYARRNATGSAATASLCLSFIIMRDIAFWRSGSRMASGSTSIHSI